MLLLISIGGMSFAAPAAYAEGFDQASASAVWGQALAFISPRALEPLSMAQMAIWGLGGVTAIDPDLSVKLQSGQLRLYGPDQILLVVNAPAAGDAPGWGHACAVVADKAYSSSAALRQAGTQGIIRSFFDELFNHFDPYSRYEAPQEAQQDELTLQGAAGLGMSVLRRGHEVLIDQVAADGPADQAGLKPGFQVLAIDGIKAGMIGLDQLQADLAGPAGSTAQLRVRAPGDTAQTITLTRADIPRQSVIVVPRKSVLEIRIIGFDHGTADQFTSALATYHNWSARGGLLREAVLTADTLLASGEVTSTAGRDPAANKVWRAEGGDIAAGLPVVVLVDGQTASAAEILSAALADNRRAVVVG
ncbi:MAG TPA: S41 family peptidase, partial [Acetobacteraceae bacterium]|nr:S41 family peptidase [Acetobacteraceae bacterium]